jgi:hypothetical protein
MNSSIILNVTKLRKTYGFLVDYETAIGRESQVNETVWARSSSVKATYAKSGTVSFNAKGSVTALSSDKSWNPRGTSNIKEYRVLSVHSNA